MSELALDFLLHSEAACENALCSPSVHVDPGVMPVLQEGHAQHLHSLEVWGI